MNTHADLAHALHLLHHAGADFQPLKRAGQTLSLDDAYAVQDQLVSRLCAEQACEVVGYKIGLTSPAMQAMCGIDTPVHGRVLATRCWASGARIDPASHGRLGLEFEIAVRIAKDVQIPPNGLSVADTAAFVDAICPALELVDDRRAEYPQLDAASLIADNAWNAGVVLGAWQPLPDDLKERRGYIYTQGLLADEGRVGDALEHPLASVSWLATTLARQGRTLRAGMFVMTGSIVQTRFPSASEAWRYEVQGLGEVAMSCEPGRLRP